MAAAGAPRRLILPAAGVILLALVLQGCGFAPVYGLVYTHVRVPHTIDLDRTPGKEALHGEGSQILISEPFSGYGLSARTRSSALGEAAAARGITEMDFADQEVFSLFGGLYRTSTLHVYGKGSP
jgi:hypothetical protein